MIKLYFGNAITIISTILIVLFIGFFSFVLLKKTTITHWGWMVFIMFCLGLSMSVLSGFKDGTGSAEQVIPNGHIVMKLLMSLGILCAVVSLVSVFFRAESFRQIAFFILSGIIIGKIALTEVFRIVHYFSTLV